MKDVFKRFLIGWLVRIFACYSTISLENTHSIPVAQVGRFSIPDWLELGPHLSCEGFSYMNFLQI
jgi:hypothetical protein